MSLRKALISLTLLALMVPATLAQDPSAPPDATPDATKPDSTKPDTTKSDTAETGGVVQSDPPIQQPDDSRVKHDGSRKDVDAIGNRKIGGRGLGNWYSLETEIRMGKEY